MSELTIREATTDDIPILVALYADDPLGAARETPDDLAPYRAAFDRIAALPTDRIMVAETGGEIVGTMQLTIMYGLSHCGMSRLHIEAVRVAASHRGGGIGSRMIRWAIDDARARGCGMVQLTSNRQRVDAARFYERLGFVASHNGFTLAL